MLFLSCTDNYIYIFVYLYISYWALKIKHLNMVHTWVLGAPHTSEINGCEKLEQKCSHSKNNLNGFGKNASSVFLCGSEHKPALILSIILIYSLLQNALLEQMFTICTSHLLNVSFLSNASSRVTGLCSEYAIIKYFGSCFTYATSS